MSAPRRVSSSVWTLVAGLAAGCAPVVLTVGETRPSDAGRDVGSTDALSDVQEGGCQGVCAGGRRCVEGECVPHWVPVHAPEVPSHSTYERPRTGHFVVWTGREVIVWGGHDPSTPDAGVYGNGLRFDPVTSEVRELPSEGAPGPRYNEGQETAVWTGTEMIVWGGRSALGRELGDGAAYHPGEDRWTRLPTAMGPSPRAGFTAVFTGTELVVWGGTTDDEPIAGGARLFFRPMGAAWSATRGVGEPPSRTGHTAVWTGAEMLVWGGTAGEPALPREGLRFAPASDRWYVIRGALADRPPCAMEQGEAPSGRVGHTAVWTSSEMLVYGGREGVRETRGVEGCARGAGYVPALDRWRPLALVGAPSARYGHVAVWTGRAMVVWGGAGEGGALRSDGASFDPLEDRWTPLLERGPEARTDARAVWTGSELVVVGGEVAPGGPSGSPVAWRYQP